MNRIEEIEARMAAIANELENEGADIDALETEVRRPESGEGANPAGGGKA